MGFKDKITKYYSDAYMNKYGDRMTSISGTVLSVKTENKSSNGNFKSVMSSKEDSLSKTTEDNKTTVENVFIGWHSP